MSTTDPAGVSDTAEFELNPADFEPDPDAKGPDPAQWDDHAARVEEPYHPGSPDSTRVDDPVYDDTGQVVDGTTVSHVKGPGPEWPTTEE